MEGTYAVMLGSQKVGTVSIEKQGLYWLILCHCKLTGEVMYDLDMRLGDKREKIGLLTPENGSFCLRAKLPIKRLGQGIPTFSLRPRHDKTDVLFVPLRPEEPFRYLSRLENAHLARKDGALGILLPE